MARSLVGIYTRVKLVRTSLYYSLVHSTAHIKQNPWQIPQHTRTLPSDASGQFLHTPGILASMQCQPEAPPVAEGYRDSYALNGVQTCVDTSTQRTYYRSRGPAAEPTGGHWQIPSSETSDISISSSTDRGLPRRLRCEWDMQIIVLPIHGLGHLIKYPKKGTGW